MGRHWHPSTSGKTNTAHCNGKIQYVIGAQHILEITLPFPSPDTQSKIPLQLRKYQLYQ